MTDLETDQQVSESPTELVVHPDPAWGRVRTIYKCARFVNYVYRSGLDFGIIVSGFTVDDELIHVEEE